MIKYIEKLLAMKNMFMEHTCLFLCVVSLVHSHLLKAGYEGLGSGAALAQKIWMKINFILCYYFCISMFSYGRLQNISFVQK